MPQFHIEFPHQKEYERTTIGPRENAGCHKSELGEFLVRQTPRYRKTYNWIPDRWTRQEIDSFMEELEEAVAGAKRGVWPVLILAVGEQTGSRRLVATTFAKVELEKRDKSLLTPLLEERLPKGEDYRVTIWRITPSGDIETPEALARIRRLLEENYLKGSAQATQAEPPLQGSQGSSRPASGREGVVLVEAPNLEPNMEEGERRERIVQVIERNRAARQRCIAHFGYKCRVCGFDFEARYGERGRGFCHVHHLRPLATLEGAQEVDPVKDLIPVCPNCHAMLHTEDPPVSWDKLRSELRG
jgi:hypothetical protein